MTHGGLCCRRNFYDLAGHHREARLLALTHTSIILLHAVTSLAKVPW